jgi:hypothetical protein
VWDVLEENEIAAKIRRVTKDTDMIRFGVCLTPAVIVDYEIKVMGRKPRKEEVVSWIMSDKEKSIKETYNSSNYRTLIDNKSTQSQKIIGQDH